MKKIIFCNLDMLKLKLNESDYEGYDFRDFDYEKFGEKRSKFILKFRELSDESDNVIYFYSRKADLIRYYKYEFHKMGYTNFNLYN